jgi:hypothetical protein
MGMIKLTSGGWWWIHSDKDRRWRVSGRGEVGGLAMPDEVKEALKRLRKKYGRRPRDLEWGYDKD